MTCDSKIMCLTTSWSY